MGLYLFPDKNRQKRPCQNIINSFSILSELKIEHSSARLPRRELRSREGLFYFFSGNSFHFYYLPTLILYLSKHDSDKFGMSNKVHYIFFLQLTAKLPESYFQLARSFSENGITLLPVSLSALVKIMQAGEKAHILCLVSTMKEREAYLRKGHKILSYLVRANIIYLYQASSFGALTQKEAYHKGIRNYFFIQLPVNTEKFCATISKYYFMRKDEKFKWPGGRNPRPVISNVA